MEQIWADKVPGYRFGRFVRPASSRSATSSRTRDIAVSGGYGNYSWQTRNSRVGSEIDEYINSLSSPQDKAKAALIIQDFAGRVTTSSSNPLGRSRYPGVIQPSHIAREGIGLSAILQANGLPALIQKARTHQTHLTRASVSGGRRYVSRYVVDFDAMSNLQANAGTLKVADFIARNMGRKNKYNTLFKQSGLPKEKWQFTENQIDESISAMLSGKGDKLIGDNIGDIIFERDFVPIIDQIMINNGASPSQITAIKRNTILRRNRGGRVPGYNRGGRVARNQNRAGGTVRSGRRFYGDFHPTLASQMGLTPTPGFTPMPVGGQQISQASPSRGMLGMMGFQAASFGGMYAGQSLGSRFGSGGAMAGSIIGSMLPMMMMGGMGGRGLGKGTEEAYNFYGNKLDKSLAGNTKFATSLANNAAQGSKFSKVLMTMVGGLTKLNLVLAGVTLAVGAGIKIFENYKKTQELSAAEFGMTSEAAEKAGLKFTDYSKKIKDAVEAQKLLIAQNKINYQNMASAGTPFKMRQLEIAFSETKEQIGTALLPIMKQFADFLLATVVPNVQALAAGLTGENSVSAGVTEATQGAFEFGEQLRSTIQFVISIKDELIILGQIIAAVFVASKVAAFVTEIKLLTGAMVALNTASAAAAVSTAAASRIGLGIVGAGAVALAAVGNQAFTPTLPGGAVSTRGNPGQTINNITVKAIDSESAARAVTKAINESAARSNPYLSRAAVKK